MVRALRTQLSESAGVADGTMSSDLGRTTRPRQRRLLGRLRVRRARCDDPHDPALIVRAVPDAPASGHLVLPLRQSPATDLPLGELPRAACVGGPGSPAGWVARSARPTPPVCSPAPLGTVPPNPSPPPTRRTEPPIHPGAQAAQRGLHVWQAPFRTPPVLAPARDLDSGVGPDPPRAPGRRRSQLWPSTRRGPVPAPTTAPARPTHSPHGQSRQRTGAGRDRATAPPTETPPPRRLPLGPHEDEPARCATPAPRLPPRPPPMSRCPRGPEAGAPRRGEYPDVALVS